MAFKFVPDAEIKPFSGSCSFTAGGGTAVVKAKFRHLTQTGFSAWAVRECSAVDPAEKMAGHLLEVMAEWDAVDASDNPMPCDLANLTAVIERHPGVYLAGVTGYVRARGTALEKN